MIVISDTAPIISLLKAGHLELLEKLYGNVLVPNAVYYELTENPAYPDEAEIIKKVKWRRDAKQLKAEYIGTAGVLMLAYDKGYIGQVDVKICLDTMISNNIRLGKKICNTVMAHVGLEEVY